MIHIAMGFALCASCRLAWITRRLFRISGSVRATIAVPLPLCVIAHVLILAKTKAPTISTK
jgi:hypothetical protein